MKRSGECGSCQGGPVDRRTFITDVGLGFTGIALSALMAQDGYGAEPKPTWRPPDGRPHFAPKAKSVIWLLMCGGVSHMESFDPKPALNRYAGKTIRETPYAAVQTSEKLNRVRVTVINDANGQQRNVLFPMQVGFEKYGQSGIEVSDWFPHIGRQADDIAFIRSMWTTDNNHGAQVQVLTGRHTLDGRKFPTIGAWIHYGLGSLNDNLPQFISIGQRGADKLANEGKYLGQAHGAIPLNVGEEVPLPFATPQLELSREEQRMGFALVDQLNRHSAIRYPDDPVLQARIKSYELAFRMQTAVPEVVRFEDETPATHKLYGLDQPVTQTFGKQLLATRRLIERGVRFIQITHGGESANGAWDSHAKLKENHTKLAAQVDLPIAGLLQDLKQRGLLEETIVVFATEFGRTPGSQGDRGRDHHPYGFSVFMAGGGIRGGVAHGTTDELGFHAEEHPHYVTDIHATIMQLLGLNARRLEVPGHKRLDIDYGEPIHPIMA